MFQKNHCSKNLIYIEREVIHKQLFLANKLSRILPIFSELLFKGAHFNDCFRTIELKETLHQYCLIKSYFHKNHRRN